MGRPSSSTCVTVRDFASVPDRLDHALPYLPGRAQHGPTRDGGGRRILGRTDGDPAWPRRTGRSQARRPRRPCHCAAPPKPLLRSARRGTDPTRSTWLGDPGHRCARLPWLGTRTATYRMGHGPARSLRHGRQAPARAHSTVPPRGRTRIAHTSRPPQRRPDLLYLVRTGVAEVRRRRRATGPHPLRGGARSSRSSRDRSPSDPRRPDTEAAPRRRHPRTGAGRGTLTSFGQGTEVTRRKAGVDLAAAFPRGEDVTSSFH